MHSCMILGALDGSGLEATAAVMKTVDLPPNQVVDFLKRHLVRHIEHVAQLLGRNEDDAHILLNRVIHRLYVGCQESADLTTKIRRDLNLGNAELSLSSKKGRLGWETLLSNLVLRPEIEAFEENARDFMRCWNEEEEKMAERSTKNALTEVLEEMPGVEERNGGMQDVRKKDFFDDSLFWKIRIRLNLANVALKTGEDRLKEESPNFSRFLSKKPCLEQMQHLCSVVKLHETLVTQFHRRLDSSQLGDMTIEEFLGKREWRMDMQVDKWIKVFIDVFNSVRMELFNWGILGEKAKAFCEVSN